MRGIVNNNKHFTGKSKSKTNKKKKLTHKQRELKKGTHKNKYNEK